MTGFTTRVSTRDQVDQYIRIKRIETKLSKLMQYMDVPVLETDRNDLLTSAYDCLCEFESVINDQLEGNHPYAENVSKWLSKYEQLKGISNEQV